MGVSDCHGFLCSKEMVFGTVPLLYGLFHDFLFAKSIIIHRMIRMNPNGSSDVGVDSREKDICS